MAGMLQILTYLLGIYLVFKGVEIFQIALMSSRPNRLLGLTIGSISIVACVVAAIFFVHLQDMQAEALSSVGDGFIN